MQDFENYYDEFTLNTLPDINAKVAQLIYFLRYSDHYIDNSEFLKQLGQFDQMVMTNLDSERTDFLSHDKQYIAFVDHLSQVDADGSVGQFKDEEKIWNDILQQRDSLSVNEYSKWYRKDLIIAINVITSNLFILNQHYINYEVLRNSETPFNKIGMQLEYLVAKAIDSLESIIGTLAQIEMIVFEFPYEDTYSECTDILDKEG